MWKTFATYYSASVLFTILVCAIDGFFCVFHNPFNILYWNMLEHVPLISFLFFQFLRKLSKLWKILLLILVTALLNISFMENYSVAVMLQGWGQRWRTTTVATRCPCGWTWFLSCTDLEGMTWVWDITTFWRKEHSFMKVSSSILYSPWVLQSAQGLTTQENGELCALPTWLNISKIYSV
jgi:hypothetical protein